MTILQWVRPRFLKKTVAMRTIFVVKSWLFLIGNIMKVWHSRNISSAENNKNIYFSLNNDLHSPKHVPWMLQESKSSRWISNVYDPTQNSRALLIRLKGWWFWLAVLTGWVSCFWISMSPLSQKPSAHIAFHLFNFLHVFSSKYNLHIHVS